MTMSISSAPARTDLGLDLSSRGLDEIGTCGHGKDRGAADRVVVAELARFEDDLQVRVAACLLHGDDLVVDALVVAREKRAAVDDHVDLVGAGAHRSRAGSFQSRS